jgi:membrane protein
MAASANASRNRAPDQLSFTKSLLIIGAAGVLNFLHGAPAASMKEDQPFGETQSGQERTQTQLRRAREPGRGRRAASPIHIPWKGWKDIFWRTVNQASEDRLLAIAAGVVFYGLLALFPAVTALVSCYGLFAKPDSINDHLSFLQDVIPAEAYSIVQDQIARVIAKGPAGLSLGFAVGLLLALWSANAGMKALMDALNIVNEEKEKRSFIRLNLVSLAFTVAGIFAVLAAGGLSWWPRYCCHLWASLE